jgi:hypothetical protein
MKFIYIIVFSLSFIFLGCPSPPHNYTVVKTKVTAVDCDIIHKKVMMKFSGRYRWIGGSTIYSEIAIVIKNDSNNDVFVNRENMFLYSKYFEYTNHTTNEIKILSKSRNAVMLEYSADYAPSILQVPFKMPKDEVLSLKLDGVKINGKSIKVEQISFIPEENVQVATE